MSHLLGLIEHEDIVNKLSDLTKRVYWSIWYTVLFWGL
jgi:hypothetical protein